MPPQAPVVPPAHTTIVFWVPLFILGSFIALVVAAYLYSVTNPGALVSKREISTAYLYYDRSAGKLVTDAPVTNTVTATAFADTSVLTTPPDSLIVMEVPSESVVFDQMKTSDSRVIFGTLLTNTEYRYAARDSSATSTVTVASMIAFGYNVQNNSLFFIERIPAYSSVHAASEGGELIAFRQASCFNCAQGVDSFFIIDPNDSEEGYTDLGPLHGMEFTGARSYRATAVGDAGCDGIGCIKPTVFEGSL